MAYGADSKEEEERRRKIVNDTFKSLQKRNKEKETQYNEPKKFLVMGGSECSGAAGTENVTIVEAKSESKAEKKARDRNIYGMRDNRPTAYLLEDLEDGWQFVH